jgi:hypothetical protein
VPAGGATTTITVTEVNHGRDTGDTVRFRTVEPFDGITTGGDGVVHWVFYNKSII